MDPRKLESMHKEIEKQHDESMRQEMKFPGGKMKRKRKRKGAKKY